MEIKEKAEIKLKGTGFKFIEIMDMNLLYTRYKDHRRLKVFAQKGLKCSHPGCKKEGAYLVLSFQENKRRNLANPVKEYHIDIYTKDFELMNIDHIIPKSKWPIGEPGKDDISNLQPMCYIHNSKKGNKT